MSERWSRLALALGAGFAVALSMPPWGWWPLAFVGVVAFVFDIVVSDPAGVVAGLVLGVLIVVLWIVAPIVIRVRGLRGDRR